MGSGSRRGSAGVAGVVVCLLLLGGCYYLRYASLVRTHLDLMIALTEKRLDLHRAEAPPRDLAEYRYPLERARDFARIVASRFGERESFRRFMGFLAAYEAALGAESVEQLEAALADLRERRREVLAALEHE